jgi:hypothetical protein
MSLVRSNSTPPNDFRRHFVFPLARLIPTILDEDWTAGTWQLPQVPEFYWQLSDNLRKYQQNDRLSPAPTS